ncbi:hypothetical protein ACTSKR_06500 [Chitinibacteraceae bacterium HSL-7]
MAKSVLHFWAVFLCAISMTLSAKDSVSPLDVKQAVVQKFKQDSRALQEYVFLAKMQCYTSQLHRGGKPHAESDLYLYSRIKLYNEMSPFLRLFDEDALGSHITELQDKLPVIIKVGKEDKAGSYYYRALTQCDALFSDKNPVVIDAYKKFVTDRKNYLKSIGSYDDDLIDRMSRDYLKQYLITPEIEPCPHHGSC